MIKDRYITRADIKKDAIVRTSLIAEPLIVEMEVPNAGQLFTEQGGKNRFVARTAYNRVFYPTLNQVYWVDNDAKLEEPDFDVFEKPDDIIV